MFVWQDRRPRSFTLIAEVKTNLDAAIATNHVTVMVDAVILRFDVGYYSWLSFLLIRLLHFWLFIRWEAHYRGLLSPIAGGYLCQCIAEKVNYAYTKAPH
jgi:hypothetical protein